MTTTHSLVSDSPRGQRFGRPLETALILPAVAILGCLGILFSGLLPQRSPFVAYLAMLTIASGAIELVAVAAAVTRLVNNSSLRTKRNIILTAIGLVALLPLLIGYFFALYVDAHVV